MNNSPTETDTKMEVLRDFVINTNVLKSAFQISIYLSITSNTH